MTKSELEKSLTQYNGGSPFVSIRTIARWLKVRDEKARNMTCTLKCFQTGREKKYFAGDVAGEVMKGI